MADIFDQLDSDKRDIFDELPIPDVTSSAHPQPPEGTITQESFGRQLSDSMRGFGRDVSSGIAGTLPLLRAGTGPLGQVMGAGFSYAGGSAGQGIEDLIRGTSPKTFLDAAGRYHQAGMKGLQDQIFGQGAGKVAEKMLAPNASKLTHKDLNVASYARENKLPMAPSDIVDSNLSRGVEWIGDSTVSGGMLSNHYRKQLGKNFEGLMEETTQTLPNLTDKGTSGNALMEGINEAKNGLTAKTTKAYEDLSKILESLGDGYKPDGTIDKPLRMENFIKTANKYRETIDNEQQPGLRQFLASVGDRSGLESSGMAKGGMTGKELDIFQKQIWEHTWNSKKDRKIGYDLWDAVEKDLKAEEPWIWESMKNAKDTARIASDFKRNPTVNAISRKYKQGNPDQLIHTLFREGNIEEVNTILKSLPEESSNIAKERFIQNILDTAYNKESKIFQPEAFLKNYSKYENQIKNVMPEIADRLDIFADAMRRSMADVKKGSAPMDFSSVLRIGGSGGASAAFGSAMGPVGYAVPEFFTSVIAHSIRSPNGVLKKWLTTGFKPETMTGMLKLGGRFVDLSGMDKNETVPSH